MSNDSGSTATFTNATISGNTATRNGGGVSNLRGTATFTNTTISGNTAKDGGGVFNGTSATATFTNATISGNTASTFGGGVYNRGTNATATFTNAIVAKNNDNGAGPDINKASGTITDGGNNLIGDGTGQMVIIDGTNGNQVGISAMPLDPLFITDVPATVPSTGGDLRLACGSPAIDMGIPDTTGLNLGLIDILGLPRVESAGGTIDIGAYQRPADTGTKIVTTLADDGPGSLRFIATSACAGDTIRFDASLDMDTIKLTSGEIVLDTSVVIIGNDPTPTTAQGSGVGSGLATHTIIDGQATSRIFYIPAGDTVAIHGVTLQQGNGVGAVLSGSGGAIINEGVLSITNATISGNTASAGGGVSNSGTATFTNTTISGNTAYIFGGGVSNSGTATFTNATISGNTASSFGGGVFNDSGSTATFTNATISGNTASTGGGVSNSGTNATATFTNATISGNTASSNGGGVYNENAAATFTNATISGNTAQFGGGVFNRGNATATFTNATISGNTTSFVGGGVSNSTNATATFTNTIVAKNNDNGSRPDIDNFSGTITNQGNNLIGDNRSVMGEFPFGVLVGTTATPIDPMFVMDVPPAPSTGGDLRLQCASPAINAGNNMAIPKDTFDIDGDMDVTEDHPLDLQDSTRVIDGTVDIGAYEYQALSLDIAASSNSPTTAPICAGETLNLMETGTGAVSWAWTGPNNYTSTTQSSAITSVTTAASGMYKVVATDAGGCKDSVTIEVLVNALPTVSASGATVCAGETINLTSSGGGTYAWSGPASFTSTDQNPTIAMASSANAGDYTVVVTNASGCVDSTTVSVTVNALPTVSASGATVCVGETINLTSGGGGTYAWSGPASFTSTDQNPTIAMASSTNAGMYTVVVTNASGCVDSTTVSVTVNALPTVSASGATVCAGETINLTSSGGGTYAWSGPASFTSTDQNPTITMASSTNAGMYTVVVTNTSGCIDSTTVIVTVNALPTVSASGATVCAGETINLTSSGGGTYAWSGPASFTSTDQNPTIAMASSDNAGMYTVVVTSGDGCIDSTTVIVTVNALPTVSASGATVCAGESINLTSSGGGTYAWSGPESFTSTDQNPTIAMASSANAGMYTVVVTNTSGCKDSMTVIVTVNALPTVSASGATVCAGETINLTSSGGGTYAWSGPASFTSTDQNPTITMALSTNAGMYTVVVTSGDGCMDSTTAIVVVNPSPTASIGATASTICQGGNSSSVTFTGSGGTAPYTFTYSVNNGANTMVTTTTGSSVTVSQATTTAGTYTYNLVSISDDNGCMQTQNGAAEITVDPAPGAVASIVGPSSICAGLDDVTFAIPTTTDATSYVWTFSDASVIINNNGSNMVSLDGITTGGTLSVVSMNNCGASAPAELMIEMANPSLCGLSDCSRLRTFIDNEILTLIGSQDLYKAREMIESDATIKMNWYKEFRAGQAIDLYPGFEVEQGATFVALIEGCN